MRLLWFFSCSRIVNLTGVKAIKKVQVPSSMGLWPWSCCASLRCFQAILMPVGPSRIPTVSLSMGTAALVFVASQALSLVPSAAKFCIPKRTFHAA